MTRRQFSAIGQGAALARSRKCTPSQFMRPEAVRADGRIRLIKVAEIDWVQASGDYVSLYQGKRAVLMHATLASLEQRLKPHGFLRIHRSTLVNKDRIRELRALDNGEYYVLMHDGTQVRLSRSYRASLQEILAGKSL
ncbi:MAG: LytTR family DNA-binding domain-containing protein [Gammaproteobacteria bacterium]